MADLAASETIQLLVDGQPLGEPIDLYAALVLPSGSLAIGTINLSAGAHTLSFRIAGKNTASNGCSLELNARTLTAKQQCSAPIWRAGV